LIFAELVNETIKHICAFCVVLSVISIQLIKAARRRAI